MLNVLLMLSTKQPPDPVFEIEWHQAECAGNGTTWLVTTRDIRGLTRGESTVAFYGDGGIQNRFLGRGTFLQYLPLSNEIAAEALSSSDLYQKYGIPETAKAMIELSDVVLSSGEELDSLGGRIRPSGLQLSLANLPRGAARIQVYYTT